MRALFTLIVLAILSGSVSTVMANTPLIDKINKDVITWRRHLHQFPELSNREFKTAQYITDHLTNLGLEITTNIAHTGVVATLNGAQPGPLIALRADMDALPITELVMLPFASKQKGEYKGQEVGVMHACGHDAHVAILMAVASRLVAQKEQLKGSVMFIFQPAEEGAPNGEEGGAQLIDRKSVV